MSLTSSETLRSSIEIVNPVRAKNLTPNAKTSLRILIVSFRPSSLSNLFIPSPSSILKSEASILEFCKLFGKTFANMSFP